MGRWAALLGTLALIFMAGAPAVHAYDTSPHTDMTRDALRAEGFGVAAGDVAAFENWLSDFYSQASKNPYSGHGGAFNRIVALAVFTEDWPQRWLDAAELTHFDSTKTLKDGAQPKNLASTAGVEREWLRLMRNTRDALAQARANRNPLQVLAALGVSLHSLQDFYTHSNWVEPAGLTGFFGPGWKGRGYGDFPTWFDIPKGERDGSLVQMSGAAGTPRKHGSWKDDQNLSLSTADNKDTPGRPMFQESYVTAYFASRMWVQAARGWLADETLWRSTQQLAATSKLARDTKAALEISRYTGRWSGGGGPCVPTHEGGGAFSCGPIVGDAGSLINLRQAINRYFDQGPSIYRRAFQQVIEQFGKDLMAGQPDPVIEPPGSSSALQASTQLVRLDVTRTTGIDLGDPGPDDADLFVDAGIAGQRYTSTVIHGHDSFSFPRPYAPHTWIKAVPITARFNEPVTSIVVRIKTGDVRWAGTDDDVRVSLGSDLNFSLEKRAYDDFERGDNDRYAIPLDRLTMAGAGLTLGQITSFAIRKSPDGVAGGWRLGGAELIVNGRTLFKNDQINRWLEDGHRTFIAPGLARDHRTAPAMPVWLRLMEDDLVYGDDDTGDVNPFDRNTVTALAYTPGTGVVRTDTGGDRHSGRLSIANGDKGRITYRLGTIRPLPPPIAPVPSGPTPTPAPTTEPGKPTPTPAPLPDLLITELGPFQVTVKNQGAGPSGPFSITVQGFTPVRVMGGLAAGASVTRTFASGSCGGVYRATVDSLFEVAESNEANNTAETPNIVC